MGDDSRSGVALRRRLWLLQLILDLPYFAVSVAVVLGLGLLILPGPWGWIAFAAWLVSGLLMLVRPLEDAIVGGIANLRRPNSAELQRLDPAWGRVTIAAGVPHSKFRLWIQKSQGVNAFAAAGHTVAVTSAAVKHLSDNELDAVLAHELGHHLGGHAWASLLRYWYSLPGFQVIGFTTYLVLAVVSAVTTGSIVAVVAIGVVVTAFVVFIASIAPVVGAVLVVLLIIPFVTLWLRRQQEYQADLIAAELGFESGLLTLLPKLAPKSQPRWLRLEAVIATHPSSAARTQHVRAWLDGQESG